ncbi:hypothetical protein AB7M39_002428 [Bradyrhizobium diazoefficiens]
MRRVNYGRTVAVIGAWLRPSVLGDVIVSRGMSGGVRMRAGRIILHLVIKPARIRSRWSHLPTSAVVPPGASNEAVVLHAARLRADAAGSANHSSMDMDVNRADKRALCQLRKRAAASNRDIRRWSQSRQPWARGRARRFTLKTRTPDRGLGTTVSVKNQPGRGVIQRFDPRLGESVSGSVSRSRTREETSFARAKTKQMTSD